MKVMLVWQPIPEKAIFYLFELNDENELLKNLKTANGCFMNYENYSDEVYSALNFVDDFLDNEGEEYEVGLSLLPGGAPVDKIFTCGFVV